MSLYTGKNKKVRAFEITKLTCFAKHKYSIQEKKGEEIFRLKISLEKEAVHSTSSKRRPLSRSASSDACNG